MNIYIKFVIIDADISFWILHTVPDQTTPREEGAALESGSTSSCLSLIQSIMTNAAFSSILIHSCRQFPPHWFSEETNPGVKTQGWGKGPRAKDNLEQKNYNTFGNAHICEAKYSTTGQQTSLVLVQLSRVTVADNELCFIG